MKPTTRSTRSATNLGTVIETNSRFAALRPPSPAVKSENGTGLTNCKDILGRASPHSPKVRCAARIERLDRVTFDAAHCPKTPNRNPYLSRAHDSSKESSLSRHDTGSGFTNRESKDPIVSADYPSDAIGVDPDIDEIVSEVCLNLAPCGTIPTKDEPAVTDSHD